MSSDHRRGDRSRREDDRYSFLEALLCARQAFYVSYVGRDNRDNSRIPPSVVVSELLDYLGQGLAEGDDRESKRKALHDQLVTVHALQGFNPCYFSGDSRYPGHAPHLARAAEALVSSSFVSRPFMDEPLAINVEQDTQVDLEQLISFYCNPARYLLRNELDVWLAERDETFEDREPFAIDYDTGEAIRDAWMSKYASARDIDGCEREMRSRSLLPHGAFGRVLLEREIIEFEQIRPRIADALESPLLEPVQIDAAIGSTPLSGLLRQVRASGLLHFQLRKTQARDRVRLILEHLAGSAAGVLPPGPSMLITLSGSLSLAALGEAEAIELLKPWITGYLQGRSRVVHFFPRSAWDMFETIDKGDPLAAARRTWLGSDYKKGESQDPYYQKVFASSDPIDAEFDRNVRALLVPLAVHLTVQ
jgi:exodeoxyribonuclease V gamma subunit